MDSNASTEAESSTACDSNESTDSFLSLGDELNKKRNYEHENLKQFKLISSYITPRYKKQMEKTPSTDTYNQYFNIPHRLKSEYDKHHARIRNYQMEEFKMKKQIKDLENKLTHILTRNQIISEENAGFRKKAQITEEALNMAKNYYSSVWDMNIAIEDSTGDKFTSIINFRSASGMFPIKFEINRISQEVLDWDASSLLSTEDEDEMKKRLSMAENYFPQVLSELRLITLNRIRELNM